MSFSTFLSFPTTSRKAQPEIGDLVTVKISSRSERTCGARIERFIESEGMANVRIVDAEPGTYPAKGSGILVGIDQIVDWDGN